MARTVLQATEDIMEAALNQTEKELDAYEEDPYDLGLQIGGVFIIMAASIAGMGTSYLFGSDADCDRKSALYLILTLMRGVGVGVIIEVDKDVFGGSNDTENGEGETSPNRGESPEVGVVFETSRSNSLGLS